MLCMPHQVADQGRRKCCGERTLCSVAGNVPQAAAPSEGILHVGFFMFGNVQKKLDG